MPIPNTYTLKRNCLICKKVFIIDHPRRSYCSHQCRKEQFRIWDKARASEKNQKSKIKSWKKKKELLLRMGGKCKQCHNKDLRVLEFSHISSKTKNLRLKKREKMNPMTRWKLIEDEIKKKKVQLECANCHRIKTHQEFWLNNIIK